ncbi:MAG: nucleotidyltransferase domain-containing protein, partial [Ktedonobacterales bacterium]
EQTSPVGWRLAPPGEDTAEIASASVRYMRLCGQAAIAPEAAFPPLRALGATLSPDDWRQVAHRAANEGMTPLVYQYTVQAGLLQALPPEVAQAIGDGYRQTLVTNLGLLGEMRSLLAALDARGITIIPLKGLSLATRYYQRMELRPTSDIDLLAQRRDVPHSDQALRALGYAASHTRAVHGDRDMDYDTLLHGDLGYLSPKGTRIELHWELTHRPTYRFGLDVDQVWSRARMVEVAGKPVMGLSPSDELRFLCVHCTAGHQVTPASPRLIWLVDIALLARALPANWDWPAFMRETIALRLATPVYLALSLAHSCLNLEPPADLSALWDACLTPQ